MAANNKNSFTGITTRDNMEINKQYVIDGMLKGFSDMYLEAKRTGTVFHHKERGWWYLPDDLKAYIEAGNCIYVLEGWSLESDMSMVEAINAKIFQLQLDRENVVKWSMKNQKRVEYKDGEPLVITI